MDELPNSTAICRFFCVEFCEPGNWNAKLLDVILIESNWEKCVIRNKKVKNSHVLTREFWINMRIEKGKRCHMLYYCGKNCANNKKTVDSNLAWVRGNLDYPRRFFQLEFICLWILTDLFKETQQYRKEARENMPINKVCQVLCQVMLPMLFKNMTRNYY